MPPLPRATDLDPGDKILFLGLPELDFIREAAARLKTGILVAIGDEDTVRAARCELRELINVMLIPGSPNEIPWQDRFFTKVIDLREGERANSDRVAAEILRVLAVKPEKSQGE